MSKERFAIISPDRAHAICFEKCNVESGNPAFYMAYPDKINGGLRETGMDLEEVMIKDLIIFLQECLPLYRAKDKMGTVIPFKPKPRYNDIPEGYE